MTRKEKLAMWRARRLAAQAAEKEAADAERLVSDLAQACVKGTFLIRATRRGFLANMCRRSDDVA